MSTMGTWQFDMVHI